MLAKKKGASRPTICIEESKVEDIIDDKDILSKKDEVDLMAPLSVAE
jgi:molybdopterin converting factor small subunit